MARRRADDEPLPEAMARHYIDACMCCQASMNYSIGYTRFHSEQLLHKIELVLTSKFILNCDIYQIKKRRGYSLELIAKIWKQIQYNRLETITHIGLQHIYIW